MPATGSFREGWYRPQDLVIWRDFDGTLPGIYRESARLLEVSLQSLTASIDSPWELIFREKVKLGRGKKYGNRFFNPEQWIWVTDRNQAPQSAIGGTTTKIVFSGKILSASFTRETDGAYYTYRVVDRRFLTRRIPVTYGGPSVADPRISLGANRLVYNPPPGDTDAAFDALGGDAANLQLIIDHYFQHHREALATIADIRSLPVAADFVGWQPDEIIPGKIALDDANFEEGLLQILGSVPHVRFYVTNGPTPRFIFVNPLRLSKSYTFREPQYESPSRDAVIETEWEITTEECHTAVRIVAKTGEIRNNWTEMRSGFIDTAPETPGGAATIPSQAPDQPGRTVGITVNNDNADYFETWATNISTGAWTDRYWPYAALPDAGGGTKKPIQMLNLWDRNFEQDLLGDGLGLWIGYRQTHFLPGFYKGGSNRIPTQVLVMSPIGGTSGTAIPALIKTNVYPFTGEDENNWVYKLTDSSHFWRTAGVTELTVPPATPGADGINRRRRRGPFAGGILEFPPQPGVPRPAGIAENETIKLQIQVMSGSDVYATVIPDQRARVNHGTWAGPSAVAPWHYVGREPGNKLKGPDGLTYHLGGRWSSMFRNYRMFDPEMVWRYVANGGAADIPRFVQYAPEVCMVGVWNRSRMEPIPNADGEMPDPPTGPYDTTHGSYKVVGSSPQFFDLFPRYGGNPDLNSGFFSVGSSLPIDIVPLDASGETTLRKLLFEVQLGWVAEGGGLEVRVPTTGFSGEAWDSYGVAREKVISVDLATYRDDPSQFNGLASRFGVIAAKYQIGLAKIPRIGSITLHGLDLDLCTYYDDLPGGVTLLPFTYYVNSEIDQQDVKPPPVGGIPATAATVQVRYDFQSGTTVLDLTEDRSGLQRNLVDELVSELRERQLLLDIRHRSELGQSFRDCIGKGQSGGGGNSGGSGGIGQTPSSLCDFSVRNPEDGSKFMNLCMFLMVLYRLAKKGGGGGDPQDPQKTAMSIHLPLEHGGTPSGGGVGFEAEDDFNPLTFVYDEFPNVLQAGPPLSTDDFTRRGSQFFWDAKNQPAVGNFYGKHNRYTYHAAEFDSDGITLLRKAINDLVLGGWAIGPILGFFRDFLGLTPEFDKELAESEESESAKFSIPSQTIGLRNTSFASWRFYERDEVPSDTALYLDFEEASGSLYDMGPNKQILTATGTPTYGATGLVSSERGITTVQASSSFAIATVPTNGPMLIGWQPFTVRLRFKVNTTGVTHTLVENQSGATMNGFRIRITNTNVLTFEVGDGTDTITTTHTTVVSAGNWYSFVCSWSHLACDITLSDGTQVFGGSSQLVGYVANTNKAFTVSGSVTWDELEFAIGSSFRSFQNELSYSTNRLECPASWQMKSPVLGYAFPNENTSDTNGGIASVSIPVNLADASSPVLFYQDTGNAPELILIPGHKYRLTIKCKTTFGSPELHPWIENLDQRTVLTTGSVFADTDTALTLTISSSAWTTNTVSFTVPTTYNAWDRWRIGVRVASLASTSVALIGGDPAILLEEVDAALTGTDYILVDSGGVRVAELDSAGAVVES